MVSFRSLFLVAVAATSALAVDYTTVLNDLKNADNITKSVTSDINAYTGTGVQTLNLRTKITNLKKAINQTIADVDASPTPTAAQGQPIFYYVNGTLFTDTKTSLTAAKNKKATFNSAGLKNEIITNLKDLKTTIESLADKLIAKAPTAALKSGGQTTKTQFSNAFTDAINYLSAA